MDSVEPMQVDDPESGGEAPPSDFTVDPPNFDLEGYANGYEGLAKVRRLMFVAKHCPGLQLDALRYIQTTTPNLHPVFLPPSSYTMCEVVRVYIPTVHCIFT